MVKLFISYSRVDAAFRDALVRHTANLRRQGRLEVWSDAAIETGVAWKPEIWSNFEASRIIVFLISVDFINSDFCYLQEFKAAMENYRAGRVELVPVVIRSCQRQGGPFDALQCLFTDKPLASFPDQDEAWTKVADEIAKKVGRLEARTRPIVVMERAEGDEVRYLCDRQNQEMSFTTRFESIPKETPQIYFLPGPEDGSHASFVRRIRFRTLPELLGQADDSLRDAILPVVAPWVQAPPRGHELGYLLDRLANTAKKQHGVGGATAADLKGDSKLSNRVLLIEHNVYAKYWNSAMSSLLREYIRFWASDGPLRPGPQVIVFLHIVFPGRNVPDDAVRERKQAALHELKALAEELDGKGCAVIPLDELSCIERDHVSDWVRCYADDRDGDALLDGLFPGDDCRPLKDVEKELAKFLMSA